MNKDMVTGEGPSIDVRAEVARNRLRLMYVVAGLSLMARLFFASAHQVGATSNSTGHVVPSTPQIFTAIFLRILRPAEQATRCLIYVLARLQSKNRNLDWSDAFASLLHDFQPLTEELVDVHDLVGRLRALMIALDDLPAQARRLYRCVAARSRSPRCSVDLRDGDLPNAGYFGHQHPVLMNNVSNHAARAALVPP